LRKKYKNFFHPNIICISGYSNSGKTTLIRKIIEALEGKYKIGYLKSDAHNINIDHPGKDTSLVKESGAESVFIQDQNGFACYGDGALFQSEVFAQCDFVLAEGWKFSDYPKIIVIDQDEEILKKIEEEDISNVIACVGQVENKTIERAPYFNRNNIQEIIKLIEQFLVSKFTAPLKGLVLAGGKSKRMKRDKSHIEYHGKPQAEVVYDLLTNYCEDVYISCRQDQDYAYKKIDDSYIDKGPMGGILSAMDHDMNSAWLVVACDLPLINDETIEYLVTNRNNIKVATTYLSVEQGLPEPLCTIYEPHAKNILHRFLSYDVKCPRKVLINSNVMNLELQNKDALMNCNTPEEHSEFIKNHINKE
jgi:molybdenum cofactor guanylyltransferase